MHGFIGKQNASAGNRNYNFGVNNTGTLYHSVEHSGGFETVNTTTVVPLNTWTHVAAVYDGNALTIYINGIEDASATIGAVTLKTNTDPVAIGWAGTTQYFNGGIDEVEIFNRALTAGEIQAIYRSEERRVGKEC